MPPELELTLVQAQVDPLDDHVQEARIVPANVVQFVVLVALQVGVVLMVMVLAHGAPTRRCYWLFVAFAHTDWIQDGVAALDPVGGEIERKWRLRCKKGNVGYTVDLMT